MYFLRFGALFGGLLIVAGCSTLTPIDPQASAPVVPATPVTAPPRATAPAAQTAPATRRTPPAAPVAPAARTAPAAASIPAAPASERADTSASPPAPAGRPAQWVIPPASLWDRIRAGFAMPPLASRLVAEKERFYLQRPDDLQRMFSRGSRYLFHIVEEIEKRGMPTELALLPFVESAMNPVALSHAQASGLWQFIPSTGRAYNLQQDWWVDNRRDVVQSTEAALDYLQKIYAMHDNDWFLALASYNWGEGAVARAVRRNQSRGLPTGYLALQMPVETRHYVPKLMALKNILLRADELGVVLPELPNRPYFVTIEKTRPIDLKLAAQFAGMSVDDFVALNPAHNRPVIAASRHHGIKLPADRLDAFTAAVERHGRANRTFATWQPHTLQAGETLDGLAQRGGVTVAELREANDLRPGQRILPGTRILAPQRTVEDETRVEHFAGPRIYELVEQPAVYHTVRRRETLASIARRYGTTIANLKAWNVLARSLQAGTNLLVRPASAQTLLTTEDGDRRVVRTRTDQTRVVHAVLRREQPAVETRTQAAPAVAKPSRNARTAARHTGSGKPGATRAATAAKNTHASGNEGAGTAAPAKRPAKDADKRT